MIQQTILPFKLGISKEKITPRSGLAVYAELMKAFQVENLANKYLPQPGSGAGIPASNYVKPLSMTLYGGGQTIEDTREIRDDATLRKMIGLERVPSTSAIGDWLKRMGHGGGIAGMVKVNDEITTKIIQKDKRKSYTLIIDPTFIEAEKKEARMTYQGFKGYRPVVAVLKELDLVIAYQFKEGNDTGGRLKIVEKAFNKLPRNKRIKEVLLDSEYYTNEILEYLEQKNVSFAIAVDKDSAVVNTVNRIPEADWQPFRTKDGLLTDREVADTVHTMNKGSIAFRLVVLRWRESQGELFGNAYRYHCIGTNMLAESSEEAVWRYNQRARIENNIKELKGGFGLERLPSGDFKANAVHFGIGMMTYNLFIASKLFVLPSEWRKKTIKSIRWLLVETAGKLVRHGRRLILKLAAGLEKYGIYLEMRRCIYALSLE